MVRYSRLNGISLLLACRNEETTLELCVKSFLDFADEILIVDNGSIDHSKQIAQDLSSTYPDKIVFLDEPDLIDLHQVRQLALNRSKYRWIVRGDADFVAYTSGEYDIKLFRQFLISQKRSIFPKVYGAPLPNLICDFWHTGIERGRLQPGPDEPGRYVPPPVTEPNPRIYEFFPGFRFQRVGRWEATSFNRFVRFRRIKLHHPLWMHCNIKSNIDYLYRSERTNWRELGDFKTYPSLERYLKKNLIEKYATHDLDVAAEKYMQTNIYPFLKDYDPDQYYPYPTLVEKQMAINPIYRVVWQNDLISREYYGINPTQ